MNAVTNSSLSIESVSQNLSKVIELCSAWSLSSHPPHSEAVILLKHQGREKLLHMIDIVVALKLHERMQTHLLTDFHGIFKVWVSTHLLNL